MCGEQARRPQRKTADYFNRVKKADEAVPNIPLRPATAP